MEIQRQHWRSLKSGVGSGARLHLGSSALKVADIDAGGEHSLAQSSARIRAKE